MFNCALFCVIQLLSNLYLCSSKSVKSIVVIVCSVTGAASSAQLLQCGLLPPTNPNLTSSTPPSPWL